MNRRDPVHFYFFYISFLAFITGSLSSTVQIIWTPKKNFCPCLDGLIRLESICKISGTILEKDLWKHFGAAITMSEIFAPMHMRNVFYLQVFYWHPSLFLSFKASLLLSLVTLHSNFTTNFYKFYNKYFYIRLRNVQ